MLMERFIETVIAIERIESCIVDTGGYIFKRYIKREGVIVKVGIKTKIVLSKGREKTFAVSCCVENQKNPIYLKSIKLKCSKQLTVSENPFIFNRKKLDRGAKTCEMFDVTTTPNISGPSHRINGEVSFYKTVNSSQIESREGFNRIKIIEKDYIPSIKYLIIALFFGFLGGFLNYLLSAGKIIQLDIENLLFLMVIGLFAGFLGGLMNLLTILGTEELKNKHYLNAALIGMLSGLAGCSFFENIPIPT